MTTDPLTGHEKALLSILELAAENGARCPSNTDISRVLGLDNFAHVSELLNRMKRKGVIAVRTTSNRRIVTILASGKSTATPPPAKERRKSASGCVSMRKRVVPAVHSGFEAVKMAGAPAPEKRDPCFKCGVPYNRHADAGCKRWSGL